LVRYCVEIGSLTGEHGVEWKKVIDDVDFFRSDFALMRRVHSQFQSTACESRQGFPEGKGCGETRIRTSPTHSPWRHESCNGIRGCRSI